MQFSLIVSEGAGDIEEKPQKKDVLVFPSINKQLDLNNIQILKEKIIIYLKTKELSFQYDYF